MLQYKIEYKYNEFRIYTFQDTCLTSAYSLWPEGNSEHSDLVFQQYG